MSSLDTGLRPESGRHVQTLWLEVPGARLHAWLVTPPVDPPWPVVVMAHGWAAVKEMNLDLFAAAMSDAGLGALVFDHRGFGASSGLTGDIDPELQIADYRAAITYAAELPDVDRGRLGVWGTSYSGGHVLRVAAGDERIRAAVAQVPTISGGEVTLRRNGRDSLPRLRNEWEIERERMAAGESPRYVAAANLDGHELPGAGSSDTQAPVPPEQLPQAPTEDYADAERWRFYTELPEPRRRTWRNRITLLSNARYAAYEPGESLSGVTVPLHVIYADADSITPTDLIEDALSKAPASVSLMSVPGGHYAVYGIHRERCARAAADFLATHLRG
jgi:pimeloyl-ACP methyl ester carboxylesterase